MATPKVTERSTLSHLFGAVSASAMLLETVAVRGTSTTAKLFDLVDESIDASAKGIRSFEFK
jgi:hypothetical protein